MQPLRGYYSPTDFDHVDMKTGNLVLTATDLVLPGNHGKDLVFQRTYNNQAIPSPPGAQDPSRWRFGFAGMVMRILEQPWPSTQPLGNLDAEVAKTPKLVMADGSVLATRYFNTYVAGTSGTATNSQQWVISANFLKYKRRRPTDQYGELHMPDGTVAYYDAQGELMWFGDGFNNRVLLSRVVPGVIFVTQELLGGVESRQVRLNLNAASQVVGLTYEGREWGYQYVNGDLVRVTPPVGPDWVYTYQSGRISTVTTPGGGVVTYSYTTHPHASGPVTALQSRTTSGPGVTSGTWQFALAPAYADAERLIPAAEVTLPSGRSLRYEHFVEAAGAGPRVLGGGTGVVTQELRRSDGQWLERDERDYVAPGIKAGDAVGAAALSHHVLRHRVPGEAGERTHTRMLQYQAHAQGHWQFHQPWTTTEWSSDGPTRVTVRTYLHRAGPPGASGRYLVALPASQTVTVGGTLVSNRQWTYAHQQWRHPTRLLEWGTATDYTPNGAGNVSTAKTANKTTTFGYNWGRVSVVLPPEAATVVSRVINPDGTMASEAQAGRTTEYTYDDLGRVTSVQGPGGSAPILTVYNNTTGRQVTTHRGTTMVTTHLDGFGRPLETIEGSGVRQRTGYDAEGRVTYQGFPYTPGAPGGQTDLGVTITYDALDRVLRETQPGGAYTERTYALTTTTLRDEAGRLTVVTHGPHGVSRIVDPLESQWDYTYDAWGHLATLAGPGGVARTWNYGAQGQLSSETSPEAGTVTYTEYDAVGRLKKKTDARGTLFQYTYDDNGRLTSVAAGGLTTTITYEPGSDLVESLTSGGVTTTITYDAAGRPEVRQDTIDGKVFAVTYTYNALDQVRTITYPSGRTVRYDYDAHGRLARVYNPATGLNYATTFVYHGSGALMGFTGGNGIPTTIELHPQRYRVMGIQSGVLQIGYQYDAAGNVAAITDGRPGMNQTFQYDVLDRLTRATGFYGVIPLAYDAHGNRQTAPDLGAPVYQYQAGKPFHLQSIGGVGNYQYDPNGNLTSGAGFTYTYRPDNMLATATTAAGTTSYAYDAEAARIKKAVAGGTTTYFARGPDGQLLTEWVNGTPTATAREYLYLGSRLLGLVTTTGLAPK